MRLELEGKLALVTGSYRGTGAGIARVLAAEGADVVVHGFEPGQAEAVADELGGRAVTGDICDDDGAAGVAEACGAVDILVNNYGLAEGPGWFEGGSDDWFASYDKNVVSGIRMARLLAPGMARRGWGRIVFVSTIGATRPGHRIPHYYAAKGALPSVTVSLAKELAGTGITVNCVSPGVIGTPEYVDGWVAQARSEGRSTDWADVERWVLERGGMPALTGHVSTTEDVGALVAFLVSDRARQMNAAHLRIDGGAADCVT